MKRIGDVIGSSPTQSDNREAARLLEELEQIAFSSGRATPLARLCAAGVEYAWRGLARTAEKELVEQVSPRARTSLRRHLQRTLEQITRPCLELEWKSFLLAMESLGVERGSSALPTTERMFLGEQPSYRLGLLYRRFPVLARLWSLAVRQWRDHITEVLDRLRTDRDAISRLFFDKRPIGRIRNLRPGLSDPHHGGRSVTLLEFECGRIIYKPRSSLSEVAWFELMAWMNHHGFAPKLRTAQILERRSYSWMEFVDAAPCNNEAAVRRFFERLGGMIVAAYFLKAVDCHRENLIAAGEHPVLVDMDALWHVSKLTKTQSASDILYRTGFFPNSRPNSLQSRSSILGAGRAGRQLARFRNGRKNAARYSKEILRGFYQGWRCLVGSRRRRATLERRVARVRAQKRRWIYWATERYAGILRASLEPVALRSFSGRARLVRRLCSRTFVTKDVMRAEIAALMQLDIPYFKRRTQGWMPRENIQPPAELTDAIHRALRWANRGDRETNQLRQK